MNPANVVIFASFLIFGAATTNFLHENVVFQKKNEFYTSHSRWLVTFVIETKTYLRFIKLLENETKSTITMLQEIMRIYKDDNQKQYLNYFQNIDNQIVTLKETYFDVIRSVDSYRLFGKRPARSLVPIIGKALNFLFGTVSESQLKSIKQNINVLTKNQKDILHVLEDSSIS